MSKPVHWSLVISSRIRGVVSDKQTRCPTAYELFEVLCKAYWLTYSNEDVADGTMTPLYTSESKSLYDLSFNSTFIKWNCPPNLDYHRVSCDIYNFCCSLFLVYIVSLDMLFSCARFPLDLYFADTILILRFILKASVLARLHFLSFVTPISMRSCTWWSDTAHSQTYVRVHYGWARSFEFSEDDEDLISVHVI